MTFTLREISKEPAARGGGDWVTVLIHSTEDQRPQPAPNGQFWASATRRIDHLGKEHREITFSYIEITPLGPQDQLWKTGLVVNSEYETWDLLYPNDEKETVEILTAGGGGQDAGTSIGVDQPDDVDELEQLVERLKHVLKNLKVKVDLKPRKPKIGPKPIFRRLT